MLVGNLFPLGVFGVLVLLILALNPLLATLGPRAALRASEIAIVAALGLAVCGYPGSGFFRYFTISLSLPAQLNNTKANWQAAHVLSYVPDGSAELGEGLVHDWRGLATKLAAANEEEAPLTQPQGALARIWQALPIEARRPIGAAAANPEREPGPQHKRQIVNGLNHLINQRGFYPGPAEVSWGYLPLPPQAQDLAAQRAEALTDEQVRQLNRHVLVAALPGHIDPVPAGQGVLLLGGRSDPRVVDVLMQGRAPEQQRLFPDIPWAAWWPSIMLWGGLVILIGIASLCIVLVVHPQWSRRELLAYPIARFVEETAERDAGAFLPRIARSRLFWYGLAALLVIHGINGLKAWFPDFFLSIPLTFDFQSLKTLFPNAARLHNTWGVFSPRVYLSVAAFAFFLTTEVSFSLGISQFLWMVFGSFFIANGVAIRGGWSEASNQNMLLFGAYLGIAAVVLFVGRRHYWEVSKGMVGVPRKPETPAYSVWAARMLALCIVASVALLWAHGLDWVLGLPIILLVLLAFFVIARVNAETGAFFMQTGWMPMAMVTAFFGIEAIGPLAFFMMAITSCMLVVDPREAVMAHLANALQISDRTGGTPPRRMAPLLGFMLIAGFVVSLVVVLSIQYNKGMNQQDSWSTGSVATMPFDGLAKHLSAMTATGTLESSTQVHGLARLPYLLDFAGKGETWLWMSMGLGLVVMTAMARLRLPWWPIHPVLFVFWGSYPANTFAVSFLVGWGIKAAVVRTAGAKGFHNLKPLMVGVIAGELLAGLIWILVGATYYLVTQLQPRSYGILPS